MKPKRIILIRHGQSQGNINKEIYKTVPDYALQLTSLGKQQAIEAGQKLKQLLEYETIKFYVSPFWRTRQTFQGIIEGLNTHPNYPYYEDCRLREQEWSGKLREEGFDQYLERERDAYSHFYYRFEGGESVADLTDRISSFLNTLHRDFEKNDFPQNCIIVTHGMTMRAFIARWLHYTVEQFERLSNPKNCGMYILELQNDGKFQLIEKPNEYEKPRTTFNFSWQSYHKIK